jgi:lipopolysaccharide transport system ATP-binding protein
MGNIAIHCEDLGKRYRIGAGESYRTLRDTLTGILQSPFKRLRPGLHTATAPDRSGTRDFWALDEVSFDIAQGEVVGVIGRNGAGKSTLLKILSRITKPTKGLIKTTGRVGSLLEVGTGFHPELTGRENIYLNGAILGMRRSEVRRKFDEIVDFAEVEKFLDTPVKRYSSGMYVRLAFAVSAHLEPEILIVDEVLAVGDVEFQKKCLGKMESVGREGRTVVLVSHNMGAIKRLCQKALYLRRGRLQSFGPTNQVIGQYISQGLAREGSVAWPDGDPDAGDEHLRLQSLTLRNAWGTAASDFDFLETISVECAYTVESPARVRLTLWVFNDEGVLVFVTGEAETYSEVPLKTRGRHVSMCKIPGHLLNDDRYFLSFKADIPNQKVIASHESILSFQVHASSGIASRRDGVYGLICPQVEWETQPALDGVN